ncbi:MAG: hypothetical protein R2806_23780 [Saprospiraceae bacterium]
MTTWSGWSNRILAVKSRMPKRPSRRARDILAERISEDSALRGWLRDAFLRHAVIHSKPWHKSKEEEAQKYRDISAFHGEN